MSNLVLAKPPDAWGWVFMLLAVNAVWSFLEPAPADTMRMKQAIVLFGALCAAVAVKFTFLILLPLGLICLTARMRLAQWGLAALTVPLWAVCFGLVVTLPYNRFETGGWFGPASMTEAHEREPSASAAIRQVARLPFVTLGVPFIPTEGLRQITETAVRVTADRLHVTEPLAWEMPTLEWPGLFTPTVTRFDYRFSWLGLFIATAAVAWLAKRKTLAVHTGVPLAMATLLIGVAFVLAVAITIRWQTHSMVPERLIVPGMVTAAVGAAAILYFVLGRLRYGIAVMLAMAGFHALPFLNWTRVSFLQSPQELVAQRQWYPLGVAAGSVKPGSRVLLFATQDAADYLLFHPDLGFPTEVHPWGKQPFSPTALASALDEIQPDTIVFERPDRLRFNWHPERANDIAVAPFTDYLDNHTSFRREPVAGLSLIYTRRIE